MWFGVIVNSVMCVVELFPVFWEVKSRPPNLADGNKLIVKSRDILAEVDARCSGGS